ncbi:hypothetical protein VTH06DRAFT_353 [Thermothelomyces fergusii]
MLQPLFRSTATLPQVVILGLRGRDQPPPGSSPTATRNRAIAYAISLCGALCYSHSFAPPFGIEDWSLVELEHFCCSPSPFSLLPPTFSHNIQKSR